MLLLLIIVFIASAACGQKKTYQIKADSVRIFSNCDTAELILENRTRTILNGVLTNKGNGVTEFRKIMIKLNDSMYAIGGDTLYALARSKNIYSANGVLENDRVVNGNNKNLQFANNNSYVIANNAGPAIISRTPMDSAILSKFNNNDASPFAGLAVRGTGCDAALDLISDSAGTCGEEQMIDFMTLKPRKDSWLTNLPPAYGDKYLLGRIELQTRRDVADYATLNFNIKSDTAFFHDGAYTFFPAGYSGGYLPYAVMSIKPAYRDPQGYNTKMPFVQVNGGLFVGCGRNWYFNSKNANDIIPGVDDVAGSQQPFYDTRFSVYADSLPLKFYKLPTIKGNAFLTYSPTKTAEGNNVAFEYKDSVYEDIRNYISLQGLTTPSDINLKENITASQFDIGKLLNLSLKDFNYKADKAKTRYTGLIAQDLKLQLPQLVLGKEGNYSIDYIKMVPYLLRILQEQQIDITDLKKQFVIAEATSKQDLSAMVPQLQQLQQQLLQQQEEIRQLTNQIKK